MSTWVIIPIKPLAEAKLRLASVLSPDQRRRLVLTMLEDVMAALSAARGIDRIAIVTADAELAERLTELSHVTATDLTSSASSMGGRRARGPSLHAIAEPCAEGLDAAVARGMAAAREGGATRVLVIPGDVPLATSAEIEAVLRASADGGAALVPSSDGDGTNALLLPLARELPTSYGPGSAARHLAAARAAGLAVVGLDLPGLAADIDQPADLSRLAGSARYSFLGAARAGTPHTIPCSFPAGARASAARDERDARPRAESRDPGQGDLRPGYLTPLMRPWVPDNRAEPAPAAGPGQQWPRGFRERKTIAAQAGTTSRTSALSDGPGKLARAQALALADRDDLARLMAEAEELCREGHGRLVTYSRKVFIPLTQLCRDVCHYCTFAHAPRGGKPAYLSREEVLAIAREGAKAGCTEALFTLGDKPELRYVAARRALEDLGHATTLDYLEEAARLVLVETGLLPHLNPGVMDEAWLARLKSVSASQGIMLETASDRLSAKGGPHHGSPDKLPAARLATLDAAGRAGVPFTTGLLIGIGEMRAERIEALLAIRDSHERHGHVQEVIVQNFRAKPGTRMAHASEPSLQDLAWTIAVARLILGPAMSIQAPPNLTRADDLELLIRAGLNDWGGVSPVTPDHVNPEAPWPHLRDLEAATERAGRTLAPRLPVYPRYLDEPERWLAEPLRTPVLRASDSFGLARGERWSAGSAEHPLPAATASRIRATFAPLPAHSSGAGGREAGPRVAGRLEGRNGVAPILARARDGARLGEDEIVRLFAARGKDFTAVCRAADELRREVTGDDVTYVVNRNINYTNVCTYGCKFCAFSKGRASAGYRDRPYDIKPAEVGKRAREAWERGATEVCLQGGIAARYTGETYLSIVHAVKQAVPGMHVHAFSPLEVWHGAETLKLPLRDYLRRLKSAGLSTLPGTAAEILDDEVRAILCPDKITTDEWLTVMRTAHEEGLGSTATIMFGHMERPRHWARHLLRVRDLAAETGGFTELVPLAFVHMESPIYLKGGARKGPTFREAVLMHAVGRLALHPHIPHIQASWVKLGPDGAAHCLDAGADDVGGTLMNESITRAAGAAHGQEMTPIDIERLIRAAGRRPRQRTTSYGTPAPERLAASFADCEVRPMSMMAAE